MPHPRGMWGMAHPLETRFSIPLLLRYHAKFGDSRSNHTSVINGDPPEKKLIPGILAFQFRSRSLEPTQIHDFLLLIRTVVTTGLSRTVSEKKDDVGRKSQTFPTPCI